MAALYWAGDYLMNFLTLVTVGRDCLDRLSYRFWADFSMNYEACISGCKSNAVYGKRMRFN